MQFYVNGNLAATEHQYPFTYLWKDVQAGTYTITAKATDNSGAVTTSQEVMITVADANNTITASKPVYANALKVAKVVTNKADIAAASLSLKLSPNPVHNMLQVSINGLQNKSSELYLLSSAGVVLKNIHSITLSQISFDTSSLISGVYFIKIVSGNEVMYREFVKM